MKISLTLLRSLKRVDDGLLLNGEHTRTVDIIHTGDIVTVNMPSKEPKIIPLDIPLDIVYEDEDLLVTLYRSGTTKRDICKALQRTESGVAARLVHLGIIDNRDIFRDRK